MNKQEDVERVSTSIRINPKVWKEAKIEAIRKDLTVSEFLEEAIREYIKNRSKGE